MTTPVEILTGPTGKVLPVQVSRAGMCRAAHCGSVGVEQRQGDEDVERAQGDDERRELGPGDQQSVQGAGGESDDQAGEQGQRRRAVRC